MAKKKQEHTGFRNEALFCFHCGQSYKINMPCPVDIMVASMKAFAKSHKDCPKTWVEPVPQPEGKTERENAEWWYYNGEHGTSSKVMFNNLILTSFNLKLPITGNYIAHPCDPDDFRRCYLLLKAVPQLKSRIVLMKKVSPHWSRLVDVWDILTEMLEKALASETKQVPEMAHLMQELGC